jgi:hypothetical protein
LRIISTHEPPSIAAGCIYLVTQYYNIQVSKKVISDIFGISDVTISKTFRKIWHYHKILLNNKITDLILEKKNALNKNNITLNENNLINKSNNNLINEDSETIETDDDSYKESETETESITETNNKIRRNSYLEVEL